MFYKLQFSIHEHLTLFPLIHHWNEEGHTDAVGGVHFLVKWDILAARKVSAPV